MKSSSTSRCLLTVTGIFHTDGGIAALNRLMVHALARAGCALDIFVLTEPSGAFPDERYLCSARSTYHTFGGNKLAFAAAVWQALWTNHYRWVFADHVNVASILAPLRWRHDYFVWLCGVEVFPPRPDWEGRLGLTGATQRLAISEYTYQSVTARFPNLSVSVVDLALDPVRHRVVPLDSLALGEPVVLNAVDGSASTLGNRVVLHVGRMAVGERYKGQDSLLRAFPLVLHEHPEAQLVLVGQGDDRPRLESLARSFPSAVQSRVFFTGYASDELLERLYRQSYVFAMPSLGEGFGLVYLEAMSRGKPCLGGRADATPFVVRDGLTGLLVDDPRSAKQIAAALNWFLNHPEETRRMGQAGYDLVRSHYLFEHFYERFWQAVEG